MTISIYPGQVPLQPISQLEFEGNLGEWLQASGIDYQAAEINPLLLFVNGTQVPTENWAATNVLHSDTVDFRPNPHGGVFKIVGKVFNILFGWLLPKAGGNSRNDYGQGKQLQTAEGKANVARLNQVVPEQFGYFKRYPDYLVPPRRKFVTPREQWLEMLLCVGPGYYSDPQIAIGNTPISALVGAQYQVHAPGANLSAIEAAQNWYAAPEVGGTSAGTAGLELSAIADTRVNPSASSYTLNGTSVVANQTFPESWGEGLTTMSIFVTQNVTVARIGDGEIQPYRNTFTADWREIAPTVGLQLEARGDVSGTVRVDSVSGNTITLSRYVSGDPGGWALINDIPLGTRSISLSRIGRTYVVATLDGVNLTLALNGGGTWAGFAPQTVSSAQITWQVQPDSVYGEIAGPFVICPVNESTSRFEVDFFFPQGLYTMRDNGDIITRTVRVSIQWREVGGSTWNSTSRTYTQGTLDQIGFTEAVTVPAGTRPEVRIRRIGARTTSSQAQDVVQWYGARCLLPAPTSYANWTTISLRIQGLGQIAANSENQIHVTSTRMLPTLANPALTPTREISAAMLYVARAVGYGEGNIDLASLQQMQDAIWTPRGDTADHVFDETVAQNAISAVLAAGMAEMTVNDGRITPVREGLRTIFEASYSSQNVRAPISRNFTAQRPDSNDGVQIEYQDEADGFNTKTVICALPGSLQLKLEKIKLIGVTSRTRAWRWGMRRAREQRYRRWSYNWATELDLLNSTYKGYVALCPDIPGMGQSALLEDYTPGVLQSSEPLDWSGENHVVAVRRADGTIIGPVPATRGSDDYEVLATLPEAPTISLEQELPHVLFGTSMRWTFPALITKIAANGTDAVTATAVNYDARIYADDNNAPSE